MGRVAVVVQIYRKNAKQNRNYPSNLDSRGEDKLASTPHSIGSYRSLTTKPELERRWTYQRRRKQQREEEEGLLLVAGSDKELEQNPPKEQLQRLRPL